MAIGCCGREAFFRTVRQADIGGQRLFPLLIENIAFGIDAKAQHIGKTLLFRLCFAIFRFATQNQGNDALAFACFLEMPDFFLDVKRTGRMR